MSPRRALNVAGELTEGAWQAQVVGLARLYAWRLIYHAPAGGHGSRSAGTRRVASEQLPEGGGFPDLVLIKGPRLVVAELKSRTGRLRPGQADWLDAFRGVGIAVAGLVEECNLGRQRDCFGDLIDPPRVEAYLWRPADWPNVHNVLRGGQEYRPELDPVG